MGCGERFARGLGCPHHPATATATATPKTIFPHLHRPGFIVSDATTPVILSACRTPIGKYLGGLASFSAPQLGAHVIKEAVRRARIDAGTIDEVIVGPGLLGGTCHAPRRPAMS